MLEIITAADLRNTDLSHHVLFAIGFIDMAIRSYPFINSRNAEEPTAEFSRIQAAVCECVF
jgi:hypothetical protein